MRILNFLLFAGFATASLAMAADPLAWKDLGNGKLELSDAGKPALVYNYGPQLKAGAPENKRRCCYVFPVYTPSGLSLLDDFPSDHWHHRGLFWSWPIVETGGKRYDIWMNFTAQHRSTGLPKVDVIEGQAHLTAESFWEAEGKDIVKETVKLTAYPAKGAERELDLELTWVAVKDPVTLQGSAEAGKSYGGLSARFAARTGTIIRADDQVLTRDEDRNPRKWAELEGVFGGKRAVLRITSDPANPGAPHQWCLRNYGFIGASFPGRSETVDRFTLEPGKPLTLRFHVSVKDLD